MLPIITEMTATTRLLPASRGVRVGTGTGGLTSRGSGEGLGRGGGAASPGEEDVGLRGSRRVRP